MGQNFCSSKQTTVNKQFQYVLDVILFDRYPPPQNHGERESVCLYVFVCVCVCVCVCMCMCVW